MTLHQAGGTLYFGSRQQMRAPSSLDHFLLDRAEQALASMTRLDPQRIAAAQRIARQRGREADQRSGGKRALGGEPDLDLAVRGVTVSATDVAVE
jgi:hypothetical protein